MKILFCPCHYTFDEIGNGGELSWAYNIANRLSLLYPESVVVTGYTRLSSPKPYRIVKLQKNKNKLDFSLLNALIFNIHYFFASMYFVWFNKFDLLHHVLPFGLDSTFNLTAIFGLTRSLPFVLGPIQSPLGLVETDINVSDMRSFKPQDRKNGYYQTLLSTFQPLAKFLSTLTLNKADSIIVVNDRTRELLISRGIQENKIVIIPPGVDTKTFSPGKITKANEVVNLVTISYLINRKRIDLILNALLLVVKKNPNVFLRIVGDGPQKTSLIKQANELGLQKYVSFEGYCTYDRISKYYQLSDIYLSCSESEGFSTVSLEALSSGLALVSTAVGGFSDIIEEGLNGYLIPAANYQTMAEKIILLSTDTNKLLRFRRNSRQKALKKYDWDKVIVPLYLQNYMSLINHGTTI
jgi:glycosyltransferase involved in cell wall biosynthesis